MIILTKDVGNDIDINVLKQYRRLIGGCLKPELDKHIFKYQLVDHLEIILILDNRLMIECLILKKVKEYLKDRIKYCFGYKDIAFQPIMIPPDASDQIRRVFILLGSLKCGNYNTDILPEFSPLLDQLYIDNNINKLLNKSLFYKKKNAFYKNLKK